MTLRGPRVTLRFLEPHDAPQMLALVQRNRTFLRPWDPTRPERYFTLNGQLEDLARAVADRGEDRAYGFGILDNGGGRLVGRINLSNVVRGAWDNATVGYWVARDCNGRGFATEAVGLILRFAFQTAGVHRVQAGVMPRNLASIRVVEKGGFRFEGLAQRYLCIDGTWEDHRIYAVTVEEWRAAQGEGYDA